MWYRYKGETESGRRIRGIIRAKDFSTAVVKISLVKGNGEFMPTLDVSPMKLSFDFLKIK
jgi:hypothetical protein